MKTKEQILQHAAELKKIASKVCQCGDPACMWAFKATMFERIAVALEWAATNEDVPYNRVVACTEAMCEADEVADALVEGIKSAFKKKRSSADN